MKTDLLRADELSRRDFVMNVAKTCLGVSVMGALAPRISAAPFEGASKAKQVGTARNVIYLYMSGGMTHLDTFGCVPGADTMGDTKTISTSADGVQIGELLPNTAKMMHHGVVINSLTSTQGAHAQGNYFQHTGYTMRGATRHPTMGAWLQKFQGKGNSALPGSVVITSDSKHPGGGFFEAAFQPLIVNNAAAGLQNSHRLAALTESDFDYRLNLSAKLDQGFQSAYEYKNVRAYADVYRDAVNVMKSEDLVAFDLNKEPEDMHDLYGNDSFGQGCLLARRLVEHGVRFVEVTLGGWDMHQDIYTRLPEKLDTLDQGLGALLGDLDRRGLLEDTLVVLTSEFGRTPKINQNSGRDHYPKAFSSVLWGGGVNGGQVYGKTDKGIEVTENKITVPDFNATIAYALGLPLDTVLYSPSKRPFTVADKGQPVTALFG
ncbi:DUF1501 domain-containing protein [Roseimicrobium sp. ORNL1]|uniref:DUF1501 domain-containing protein n=1 Tax=Roseimicrobium sp. ORNL1 TaxID=2711231 RepID=UPI0013E1BE6A|nr:DUF1501 domain-containing protein [Roseimicrobium sp. ORNL1]QIF02385.1 DUF1501 domain-containing protein [Roseimicrobium sp. ORNL1]